MSLLRGITVSTILNDRKTRNLSIVYCSISFTFKVTNYLKKHKPVRSGILQQDKPDNLKAINSQLMIAIQNAKTKFEYLLLYLSTTFLETLRQIVVFKAATALVMTLKAFSANLSPLKEGICTIF